LPRPEDKAVQEKKILYPNNKDTSIPTKTLPDLFLLPAWVNPLSSPNRHTKSPH
jgi:hypothetical protein